jgi:hypothetical protein
LATYNAIRNTGNNNPILLEPSGTRPPGYGGTPLQSGMNPADYAKMTNVIWDPHCYGYQSSYDTNQADVNANVKAMITASQTIRSANGLVPVIIGEYGPGTDPNGMQEVSAVIKAGSVLRPGAGMIWD